jgi:hypothetical protein
MSVCELLHIASHCRRRDGRKFADSSTAALQCALFCVCFTVRHAEVFINQVATSQHTTLRHAKLVTFHQNLISYECFVS